MRIVYKYELQLIDLQYLELPWDCEILTVQTQKEKLYIWAIIDTEEETRTRIEFHIKGTGYDLKDIEGAYLGTFQLSSKNLIFHVWYKHSD